MNCINPFHVPPKVGESTSFSVPCGQCAWCKGQRAREWALRCIHELVYWDKSVFVTLTYCPDELPKDQCLRKRDLQLFFKRLRKAAKRKLRYYACGQYGDKFLRPHYHAIIFGVGADEKQLLTDSWGHGFVDCGTVTFESCRYVANYLESKPYTDKDKAKYDLMELTYPFQLQSQGIGGRFITDNFDQLSTMGYVTQGGIAQSLPRYYKQRLLLDKEAQKVASALSKVKQLSKLHSKGIIKANDIARARQRARARIQATIIARNNLKQSKV